ncbi:hypothetical protein POM88_002654 [Heracleum sosnowskyi]|uniref:Uncharacterized protein n=1 Tax=Heracleum sosnowskyi TaxID=360622 RepID=A0AAD8JGI2_9APIA|nr:hypothetical protein POM88_002654 [Heracleum sosnowskyi]
MEAPVNLELEQAKFPSSVYIPRLLRMQSMFHNHIQCKSICPKSSGIDEAATNIKQPENISLLGIEHVDEPVEESPAQDVGNAYNTKSKSSNILTIKSLLCQEILEIEDDPLLDHLHQLSVVEISKGNKSEKGINFEILSEHFGKPLVDAAESFHVSPHSNACVEIMVLQGGNLAREAWAVTVPLSTGQ